MSYNINFKFYNVITHDIWNREVSLNDDKTLQNALEELGQPTAEIKLEKYYIYNYESDRTIPYIAINNKVEWSLNYNDVRIKDLLDTLELKEGATLEFNTGIPQAGGPGLIPLPEMWDAICSALLIIAPIITVTRGIYDFGKCIKNLFLSKDIEPKRLLDFITSKNCWNHKELGMLLNITGEEAKDLLKGLGFEWDRQIMLYIKTIKTEEIIKSTKNISFYDM